MTARSRAVASTVDEKGTEPSPGRMGGRRAALWVGMGATVLLAAIGLAWAPWLAAAAVFGGLLLAVTVLYPLPVLAVVLALGPLDLSFLTGGLRALFAGVGGLDMNGIRLVGVTAALSLLILADPRQRRRLAEPGVRWYVVFLGYGLVSLAFSGDPLEGLRLLFKLAWPLVVYLTVSGPDTARRQVDRMVDWILIGAAVLMVVNPFFVLGGNVVVEVSGDVRIGGAGIHQNPFSFYLLVVVLVSLGRFASRGHLRYIVVALGAIFWMALTLTRITLLAGLVALTAAGLYGSLARRRYRPVLVAAGLASVIGVALTPMVLMRTFGYVPGPIELFGLLSDPIALYSMVNWQGRELFWGVLVASWMANPVFGLGLGSSSGILKSLFTTDMGTVAHNEYVRLGTDTGFLGIGLFFVAMMAWIRRILTLPRAGEPAVQEMALPALAVILAWGVISITDNAFDYYAPLTQFAGFLVGASVVASRDPARE